MNAPLATISSECKESLLKDWFVHRGRPRLIRMDPDGCYMSNEMLDTPHHDLGILTSRVTTWFFVRERTRDVSTSVLTVPYLPWKVIFYIRVLNAPGPVLLGADVHEDLGLVVDHVDCSVFLSHSKPEDTVERLPSRHLALSLRTEDVKAQYEALIPETRERLNNVSSQKEVVLNTNVSLALAHGDLKISRRPLLRVYRDVPVKDEPAHESEIDLSVEPHTTDEHDGISSTRKRRRLTHMTCFCTFF